jgi:hypothetical protein
LIPILLHGLYDFFLFVIVGYSESLGSDAEPSGLEALLILGAFLLFIGTFIYTIYLARKYFLEMKNEQLET